MNRTTGLDKRIALVLGLILVLMTAGMQSAFAADTKMPDLSQDKCSITIHTIYTDEDDVTRVDIAEFTLFKVADLTVKNGVAKYTLTKDYKGLDVDFNNMTAEASIDAANLFFKTISENGLTTTGITGTSKDGYTVFEDLTPGAYLVVHTNATDDAEKYSAIDPYLALAPQPLTELGENDWKYDVESIPKMVRGEFRPPWAEEISDVEAEYEDDEEAKEVVKGTNTGDDNLIAAFALVLIISACMIIFIALKRRRDDYGTSHQERH